ncbi:MAG: hypothetical protein Q8P46_06935 [Hyphomicrobiales bacterium]|nr:hypothetical protein [Hyphomicrobiales bacterium]
MSIFGGSKAKPTPLPPAPRAEDKKAAAAATTSARLLAAQSGGYQSTVRAGGMGLPDPLTTTAKLLGL